MQSQTINKARTQNLSTTKADHSEKKVQKTIKNLAMRSSVTHLNYQRFFLSVANYLSPRSEQIDRVASELIGSRLPSAITASDS